MVVPIQRIDTGGIYFNYSYLSNNYSGHFPLGVTAENFYDSDSLKIKLSKNKPLNFEFVSVVKRKWPVDDAVVSLNANNRVLYGYHDIDTKPLFEGVNDANKNDSAIGHFFKEYYSNMGDLKKTGMYIIIDGKGNSIYKSSRITDDKTLSQIKETITSMPEFTPPMNKDDTVSVVYLIEVPVPKSLP
jgi:hypothetical protein